MPSPEQLRAEVELLQTKHALTHARNNALAFNLRAQLSRTPLERADNLGAAAYWQTQQDAHTARAAELMRAVANLLF